MKKVTILNGSPGTEESALDEYLAAVARTLASRGGVVTTVRLRDLEIHQCTGCWGCWVKTPGECVLSDDGEKVCREVIGSGLTVFAGPLTAGFTGSLLKRAQDRLIPLLHPYFDFSNGEYRHRSRYDSYPALGVITEREPVTDEEDMRILRAIYTEIAKDFKSELSFLFTTETPATEVADEIGRV